MVVISTFKGVVLKVSLLSYLSAHLMRLPSLCGSVVSACLPHYRRRRLLRAGCSDKNLKYRGPAQGGRVSRNPDTVSPIFWFTKGRILDLSISLHSGYRCSFLFLSSVPIRH
jgi:hypothetical protein